MTTVRGQKTIPVSLRSAILLGLGGLAALIVLSPAVLFLMNPPS